MIRSSQEKVEAEMKACLGVTEACLGKMEVRIETGQEPREAEINTDLEAGVGSQSRRSRGSNGASGSP